MNMPKHLIIFCITFSNQPIVFQLAAQYLPVQMPEFFNVPLHEDRPDVDIIPVETKEDFEYPDIKDMQVNFSKLICDFFRNFPFG